MPLYGSADPAAMLAAFGPGYASKGMHFDYAPQYVKCSALTNNFNRLWATALVNAPAGVTHFAMLHGDVCPPVGFLDTLWGIQELIPDCAVISAVIPLKTLATPGLTSTAIGDPNDTWHEKRRLTLTEIHEKLPETFEIADCIAADLAAPGDVLLVNTGCMLVDLRRSWVRATAEDGSLRAFFTIRDRLLPMPNGQIEVQFEPEDWAFSRMAKAAGEKVYATRAVCPSHAGGHRYESAYAWGLPTDPGDRRHALFGEANQ
jgi:hypothetical protein